MASERQENTVAQSTFAPFSFAWRMAMAIVLLWLVQIGTNSAYVRLNHLDGREHVQSQMDAYGESASANGLPVLMAQLADEWLLGRWKLHKALDRRKSSAPDTMDMSVMLKKSLWVVFSPELTVALHSTVLFAFKVGIAVTVIPVLIVWLWAFAADGWVQRYIRRACGGRESATLYHRAKLYGVKLLPPLACVIFLCSPVYVDPLYVFLPAALISAILVRVQATYYKKYL